MSKTKSEVTVVPAPAVIVVPKLQTGDDDAVAAQFNSLLDDAQNGLRRVIAFGLFAMDVKLNKLKHSQFKVWVEATSKHSYRTVRAYLNLTESTLKACGVKAVKPFIKKLANQNGSALPFSHPGELLLLPDAKIPEEAKPLRTKIFDIVDGKSQRQLFAEFKQADDDEESLVAKRGRKKGCKGTTKEQRDAAKAAEEKARITAMELDAKDFGKWMDDVSDEQGIAKISDKAFEAYFDKLAFHYRFCSVLAQSRNGGNQK